MIPTETMSDVPAWYALRRTLPTWSFENNLAELKVQLPKYKVDELIVKLDTEEFTHGQPPLDWVQNYQKNLFRIKDILQEIGVRYSLNPWITVGHNDRGRDAVQQLPGLQTTVGHDGTQCTCCACPISQVWRDHVAKVWTSYAETHPFAVWVEDDIRTFNHGPVKYGCFCPLHMQLFSEKVGEKVSRENLVNAILSPGKPHPWRKIYLDMQAEIMIDTVAFLAQTVHKVSPETRLGLMSSGARTHCLEGRRWHDFAEALADGQPLYSRPPMGNYHEASLRGFYHSHDSIKLTRHCMPPQTVEQTEVENVPFTQYSKSATFTFLEMAISFAYGSHGVTMNLYDHCGTPMEREPVFGEMLAEKKPFLSALAAKSQQPGSFAGVQLLFHDKASYVKQLSPGAAYIDLQAPGYAMMENFESHGIPTTYATSSVIAVQGQILRSFSDDEIRELLSKALFLDATSANVLCERGFGADIGIEGIETPVHLDKLGAFAAEEYFNPEFGGEKHKFLTLTIPNLGGRPWLSRVKLNDEAEIISRIVDPDVQPHYPCMFAFKNSQGGRIIVHALDADSAHGIAFNHTFRAEQFQNAVRWLANDVPPMLVRGDGVYPLAFRKDFENGETMLGLFNLTLDPWSQVVFEMAAPSALQKIQFLDDAGNWLDLQSYEQERKNGAIILTVQHDVPHSKPLFLMLSWE